MASLPMGGIQHMTSGTSETTAHTRPRRPRQPRISIVVPALNEARNLAAVLPTLPAVHEVILVDGGSVDGTVETAQAVMPDIRVVRQLRRGKGNALAAGFAQVTGDVVVMFDADGSADPAEIPAFVDALVAGADFAKGSRFRRGRRQPRHHADPQRRQQVPQHGHERVLPDPVHRPLLRLQRLLDRHDPGPRPPRPRARGAAGTSACSGATASRSRRSSTAGSRRPGVDIVEVPSVERDRIYGTSNLRAVSDGLRVLRTLRTEYSRSRGGFADNASSRTCALAS